jgi:hypothetical protein
LPSGSLSFEQIDIGKDLQEFKWVIGWTNNDQLLARDIDCFGKMQVHVNGFDGVAHFPPLIDLDQKLPEHIPIEDIFDEIGPADVEEFTLGKELVEEADNRIEILCLLLR